MSSVEDYKKLREYEKETFEKMVSQVRYGTVQIWVFLSVLQIRDVYPGSEFFHPGSRVKKITGDRFRIRIKEFKYFNPQNCDLGNMIREVKPGFGSWIRILDFLIIPDSGSKRHRIPDPLHCFLSTSRVIFILESIKLFRVCFIWGSFWPS